MIGNERRELLAVHHTGFIVPEAGQIYRGYTNTRDDPTGRMSDFRRRSGCVAAEPDPP
ncbi:MAG: hypothetical protein MUF81_10240 [Verrucomicrobia bacterium]|nr:hypothetical protein [Verrucomicrobiota bacterium]